MKTIQEIIKQIEEDNNNRRLAEQKKYEELLELQQKQKEEHQRRMKIYENKIYSNSGGDFYIDIPNDFYITTLQNSSQLLYYSDSFHQFDLSEFLSKNIRIRDTNEVLRNGKDFFIIGNFSTSANPNDSFLVKLTNCRLKNGVYFTYTNIEYVSLSPYINYVYGSCFYKGNVYLCSRAPNTSTATIIAKVNSNNINDITKLTLPSDYLTRRSSNIIAYKDNLYLLISNTGSPSYLVRVDLNLTTSETIITTGTTSVPSRRVRTASNFLVYNDEIYIPIINFQNTVPFAYWCMGMEVYDLEGVIKRKVYNQTVSSSVIPYLTNYPEPHWLGAYNDKIIISSTFITSTTSNLSLIRMDVNTLFIEDSIPVNNYYSDDNSIFSNGYIYLNSEKSTVNPSFSSTPVITRIKYNDFSDKVDIKYIDTGSNGSLNPTSYII